MKQNNNDALVFENENARLLFEEVKHHFPSFNLKKYSLEELTESLALTMYCHAKKGKLPIINEHVYVPSYKMEVS